ncbi:MAG: DUF4384 domain-containing protein, partial [Chloroflexi bacterium]|nr:DUF4384 domain-containing protein [Chloroflexota bacterium]
ALRPQLQFEILAKRQAETSFNPLPDSDTLASEVDDYLVVVCPLSAGWLYLFQVDSSGKKEWLFPQNSSSPFSSGTNPVAAGQIIQVPSEQSDRVLFLDTTAGLEHLYAGFTASRWPELKEALAKPAPERPATLLLARTVQEPLGLRWRGVGGTRTNAAPLNAGTALERIHHDKTYALPISSLAFDASGSFLEPS